MASSGTIGKFNTGGNDYLIASTAFATCYTSASTAAKVATIQDSADFTLIDGITIHVYFDSTNTAASPTLNVNNTGAHSIYFANNIDTAVPVGTTPTDSWATGTIITLTYYNKEGSSGVWYINNNAPATGGGVDSTDTSNKIFLIGAETQGTNVSTYSDNQVYATSGQLDMNKARIAEHVTMQYNSTTEALDFVFA